MKHTANEEITPNVPTAKNHRYCVIMCGGVGSRFWPYSRNRLPKQFLDFFGVGRSLLQMTYDRLLKVVPRENILVVTNSTYAPVIREQLPELDENAVLCEPARRNTAPCVAWAAYHVRALDPEAVMIVAPSDHLVTNDEEFNRSVMQGFEFVAAHDALLTLGIHPTRPETGYGYIQVGAHQTGDISKVKTFTEKPDLELAKVFLASGEFFWNSGIFIWKADSVIKAIETNAPDLAVTFNKGLDVFGTKDETEFIDREFPACPSISIDYAVMEKASNVYVETVKFGWNDLGCWSALYDHSPKNKDGNVTQNCNVLAYNSTGNIFTVREEKLVVVEGLKDYIVSDAGDVLLICPKSDEQRIKQMVNDAKISFGDKYL